MARGLALEPTTTHGRRLKQRDRKMTAHLLVFLEDASVPPTPHSSAQARRLSTGCRKVTNGFRAEGGRDLLAAVRAMVNTGKRQGWSPVPAMQNALSPTGALFDPG
ncbi:MAG TPA: hypothetical protein VGC99_00395 [Candidatus Tectomicrobia bacterium]